MINSAEEFLALRTSDGPTEYERATHESAPLEVWLEIIERYPDMKIWVVHNKTVPVEILVTLSHDSNSLVRSAVARKRKVSSEILERLAQDSHESVRLSVAANASAPVSLLHVLAEDTWETVAQTARERLGHN